MKPAIAVLAVSLSALAAKNPAPQTIKFDLSKDGIEHIVGSFTVEVWKKSTTVSIVVQNNSPAQLRRVSVCVQGASGTCAFKFWNTETLPPGGSFRRTLTEAGELTGPFTAALEEIDPDKFAKIRRIYVEWIEGSDGVLAREQLMASLANSSRFKLVEDPKLADAFLRGHCEEREKGTLNQTSALEQSTNRSTGMKAGLAVGTGTATLRASSAWLVAYTARAVRQLRIRRSGRRLSRRRTWRFAWSLSKGKGSGAGTIRNRVRSSIPPAQ